MDTIFSCHRKYTGTAGTAGTAESYESRTEAIIGKQQDLQARKLVTIVSPGSISSAFLRLPLADPWEPCVQHHEPVYMQHTHKLCRTTFRHKRII